MRMAGLEPARSHLRKILSLVRLPFRHIRILVAKHATKNPMDLFVSPETENNSTILIFYLQAILGKMRFSYKKNRIFCFYILFPLLTGSQAVQQVPGQLLSYRSPKIHSLRQNFSSHEP